MLTRYRRTLIGQRSRARNRVHKVLETLNDAVDRELRALSPGMRAQFARICELIAAIGLSRMGAPHVRYLTDRRGRCA